MKKCILFCLFLSTCHIVLSSGFSRKSYIHKYKKWAIAEMHRTGIPASVTLAQGILESNCGNSKLAIKGNNHFGIKCHGWKGKQIREDDDKRNECFRKYESVYDSYRDHSDFLTNRSRYEFLFNYKSTDYKSWAKGLKKAGYATAHDYAIRLIKIIEEEKLFVYDRGGEIEDAYADNRSNQLNPEVVSISTKKMSLDMIQRVHYRNGVKYLQVEQGDTYYSIERKLNIKKHKILKFNEFGRRHILKAGEIIYLERKKKKAKYRQKIHRASGKERLFDISQLYAVQFKKLKKYNPNLPRRNVIKQGKNVWLRKKR